MYPKLLLFVLSVLAIGSTLAACQESPSSQSPEISGLATPAKGELRRFEYEFPSMGTLVHIAAFAVSERDLEPAIQAAQLRVKELASILTDYDPSSETRQLSLLASKAPIRVSDPLWDVLQAADAWNKESGGALDCSLGTLTQMWRKYRRAGKVPTQEVVMQAKQHSGWKALGLNAHDRTVTITDEKIRLDFGAIGKGYIADEAYRKLVEQGIEHCLVDISGNMRCGLPPPGRNGWVITVSPIEPNGQPLQKIELANQAIATSGDLWQFTLVDGIKRSHVLDPKTGYGVVGPLAVTVIAPTAIDADALATTGCVLEWPNFLALVESRNKVAALRASRMGKELWLERSSSFPAPN